MIKGIFSKEIYHSDKGYIIGLLKIKETDIEELEYYINKSITFTGTFAELTLGDNYYMEGNVIDHPKYGLQFNVTNYERIKPEDKDGIVLFLSSDLFKGIGKNLATSIVETLGNKALDIIINNKEELMLVPKMTNKKANTIYETLIKYEESSTTLTYLTSIGFGMNEALDIYNTYKSNTLMVLKHNIYSILDEVPNLYFSKIDEIRKALDIEDDDERRIKATLYYSFNLLSNKTGDTYFYIEEIKKETENILKFKLNLEDIILYLDELRYLGKIYKEEDKYFLKDVYEAEKNIADTFIYLNNKEKTKYKKLEEELESLQNEFNITYNEEQKLAIKKSLENNILVITGGPGTGKTTIVNGIVKLYSKINKYNLEETIKNLALLSPTGRASKKLSEATTLPASTIHRFLKWNKETNEFMINEHNKDFSKLIIVDEVSMIDTKLMDSLLKGLTKNIKLILVGDYHQLPSVGAGNILKDIIESSKIEVISLEMIYRQSEQSYIPVLASQIRNNNLEDYLDTKDDYTFLRCPSNVILKSLEDLSKKLVERNYDMKKVQILSPMYAGINGIDNLNKHLQNIFNPASDDKKEVKIGDIIYRINDKILELVNMPDENVFNGDIGFITNILFENESESNKIEIYVEYDFGIVKYLPKDLNKIKHGFAISIHKSQGSEFDFVIMPICHEYKRMLYKKLIYTGITRAKRKLVILGEEESFINGIYNENEIDRKTNLKNLLTNSINN